jgi:hypothetical protein
MPTKNTDPNNTIVSMTLVRVEADFFNSQITPPSSLTKIELTLANLWFMKKGSTQVEPRARMTL